MFRLIRGDTDHIQVAFFNNKSERYTPKFLEEGDNFTLTVRRKNREDIELQKVITYPNTIFSLTHEDTKALSIGKHDFDIEYSKPEMRVVKTLVISELQVVKDITY